jgi:hypothetical protein
LVQAGAAIVTFLILAAASILLTNALFNVMASSKPAVTFSIVTATPTGVAATDGAAGIRRRGTLPR